MITPEVLGERVEYLESVAGPPIHVVGDFREYRPGGCHLMVGENDGLVEWLEVESQPSCSFNIGSAFPSVQMGDSNQLTFGSAGHIEGPLTYRSQCLSRCPTNSNRDLFAVRAMQGAGEGGAYFLIAHFRDFETQKALAVWSSYLRAHHGEAWLTSRAFDCSGSDPDAAAAFSDLKVDAIAIGKNIPFVLESTCETTQATAPAQQPYDDSGAQQQHSHYSFTAAQFKKYIIGVDFERVRQVLGNPLAVHEGIEAGTHLYDYSPSERYLGSVFLSVYDDASGLEYNNITIVTGPSGKVIDVQLS